MWFLATQTVGNRPILNGYALRYDKGGLYALDRGNGELFYYNTAWLIEQLFPKTLRPGYIRASRYDVPGGKYFFPDDRAAIRRRRGTNLPIVGN